MKEKERETGKKTATVTATTKKKDEKKKETDEKKPTRHHPALIPGIAFILISAILGFIAARTLPAADAIIGSGLSLEGILGPILAIAISAAPVAILIALVGLSGMISLDFLANFAGVLAGVSAFAIAAGLGLVGWALSGLVVIVLLIYYGSVRREARTRIQLSVKKSMDSGLGFCFNGIMILACIGLFLALQADSEAGELGIPGALTSLVSEFAPTGMITEQLGCSASMTIAECKAQVISQELSELDESRESSQQAKDDITGDVDDMFLGLFGESVPETTRIGDAFEGSIGDRVSEMLEPLAGLLPLIFAFVLFGLLSLIRPFTRIFIMILGSVLLAVGKVSGIIMEEKKMVECTRIRLR